MKESGPYKKDGRRSIYSFGLLIMWRGANTGITR
jgi:hypothetical protein